MLAQLHPKQLSIESNPIPDDVQQVILDRKFIPDGIEDAAMLGKESSIMTVWKTNNTVHINILDKCFQYEGTEPEITIHVSGNNKVEDNNKVEVNNKMISSTSLQAMLTEQTMKAMLSHKNSRLFLLMAEYAPTPVFSQPVLKTACQYGPAECVAAVLEKGSMTGLISLGEWFTLELAAANGQDKTVEMLVQQFKVPVECGNYTALGWAVACNHMDTVRVLVRLGAGREEVVKVPNSITLSSSSSGYDVINTGHDDRGDINEYLASEGIQWRNSYSLLL